LTSNNPIFRDLFFLSRFFFTFVKNVLFLLPKHYNFALFLGTNE